MVNNIEKYRKEQGLTQEQLAKQAGLSRLTIINIESGNYKDLKASTMKNIAKALGKSIDDCFLMEQASSALNRE